MYIYYVLYIFHSFSHIFIRTHFTLHSSSIYLMPPPNHFYHMYLYLPSIAYKQDTKVTIQVYNHTLVARPLRTAHLNPILT